MALTPKKFSEDTAKDDSAWAGDEISPFVIDPGGTPANRKATILQQHRLVPYNVGSLPTDRIGQMIWVNNGFDGDGCVAVSDGTSFYVVGPTPYDVGMFYPGTPADTVTVLQKICVTRNITFPADFAGSVGDVDVSPDATYTISVKDDAAEIGTVSISTGGVFTFATTSNTAKNVDAGSILTFEAPAGSPAEASIEGISFTLNALIRLAT